MIGWLQGLILDKSETGRFLLNVNGVGYDVETSLPTYFKLENMTGPVSLFIHMVVREDAQLLFGFIDQEERQLFRALIKVNGVGPKVAMAILSSVSPEAFIQCIQDKDIARLTQFPGIGKKTAERLVVEMADSLSGMALTTPGEQVPVSQQADAISALEALGYKKHIVAKLLRDIDDGGKSSEQLIREALKALSL